MMKAPLVTLKGQLINTFGSLTNASRELNFNYDRLVNVLRGRLKIKEHERVILTRAVGGPEKLLFPSKTPD